MTYRYFGRPDRLCATFANFLHHGNSGFRRCRSDRLYFSPSLTRQRAGATGSGKARFRTGLFCLMPPGGGIRAPSADGFQRAFRATGSCRWRACAADDHVARRQRRRPAVESASARVGVFVDVGYIARMLVEQARQGFAGGGVLIPRRRCLVDGNCWQNSVRPHRPGAS